ncbi:MAG: YceD family protein [Paracoccaceae bacterium]
MTDSSVLATARVTRPVDFDLRPEADARQEMAERLGILAVRKLTFAGSVAPAGARDLKLDAVLGATVQQACVVSGEPVTTRLDAPVLRAYLADMEMPTAEEAEMPEDDSAEPLPVEIDLAAVMEEALALALPDWPRADGVEPVDVTVTEPGVAPMTDEDAKPFAGLKALRDKMQGDGES